MKQFILPNPNEEVKIITPWCDDKYFTPNVISLMEKMADRFFEEIYPKVKAVDTKGMTDRQDVDSRAVCYAGMENSYPEWLLIGDLMAEEGGQHFIPFFRYLYEHGRFPYNSKHEKWKFFCPHKNNTAEDYADALRINCFSIPHEYISAHNPGLTCSIQDRSFKAVLARVLAVIPEESLFKEEGAGLTEEDLQRRAANDLVADQILKEKSDEARRLVQKMEEEREKHAL